ncbi:MAG: hypothetical protein HY081_08745, partial [Gammaproteobacteria bacterium]|nr:hypothetical protein [Gammaproteobacteria bacterium]
MKKNNLSIHARIRSTFWITGIVFCGATSAGYAGDVAYGYGYNATYSDNIARTPSRERSDWIHSLIAGVGYRENTTDIVAQVLAQAEYRTYQNNSFSDETIFNLNSSLLWVISPQRFTWSVVDTFRQSQTNPTLADTPANRSNVNVFSTGPDFYLRFSPVNTLAFGGRVANVYTGDANADNNRFSGTTSWLYQSSSISTYSLNYQLTDVRYSNSTLNNNFTRQDVFLRAQFQPTLSRYVLDVGSTQLNRERGKDLTGSLTRFSWTRQSTPEATFGASVSQEFSDTGTDILAASAISSSPMAASAAGAGSPTTTAGSGGTSDSGSVSVIAPDVLTSDVYYAKRGSVFYARRGSRTGVRFEAYRNDLDYETFPLDRRESGARFQFDYYYSSAITAGFFTEYTQTKYLNPPNYPRKDNDQDTGVRVDFRANRTISLGVEGRHTLRNSTIAAADFTENRVLFSIAYSTGPIFTP